MPPPEALESPLPRAIALEEVTDAELTRFADLIYARTGIRVSPQKRMLLSNRLRRRLRATGVKNFGHYFDHLKRLRPDDAEWDAFLQEITTHETYLFRDESQWRWFRGEFLPECAEAARSGRRARSLRIWSAACSTGDEPATAACCIAASLPNFSQWNVRITATDIGVGALDQARRGEFGQRAMRLAPDDVRRRFFAKDASAAVWRARPILTDMIAYRQHNLMQPLEEKAFDLVMLKNVLIYFDPASRATVVGHVRASIRPGGYLLIGAAEGVSDLLHDFHRLHPWLYRRPAP